VTSVAVTGSDRSVVVASPSTPSVAPVQQPSPSVSSTETLVTVTQSLASSPVVGVTAPSAVSAAVTPPSSAQVVQVISVGPQGPSGSSAGGSTVDVEVAATVSAGQAVRPNNAGKLVLAQADTMSNSQQVGIAGSSAAVGFTTQLSPNFLTLQDWTAATGSVALTPQAQYFLSASIAGLLTTTPPSSGVNLAVGVAISTTTLAIIIGLPIKL